MLFYGKKQKQKQKKNKQKKKTKQTNKQKTHTHSLIHNLYDILILHYLLPVVCFGKK